MSMWIEKKLYIFDYELSQNVKNSYEIDPVTHREHVSWKLRD